MTALSTGAGEYAIYRDNDTGLQLTVLEQWEDVEWDTVVVESDTDVIDQGEAGSLQNLILKTAGRYLITYGIHIDTSTTLQYQAFEGRLVVGDDETELPNSLSSAGKELSSGAGGIDPHLSNVCIYNATANATIKAQVRIAGTQSNAGDIPQLRDDLSGITVLKLNDNWEYCELSITDGAQALTNLADTEVEWDEATEIDTDIFTWSSGTPTQVTVDPGWYMSIGSFGIALSAAGVRLEGALTWLEFTEDPPGLVKQSGGGGGFSNAAGSSNFYVGHACVFENTETTAKTLELHVQPSTSSAGSHTTIPNQGKWILVKLPDGIDESILTLYKDDDVQLSYSTGAVAAIEYDNEDQKGSHYSHSTSDSPDNVTVNTAGDYLFLYGFGCLDSTSSFADDWIFRWRKNGTALQYSNSGVVNGPRNGLVSAYLGYNLSEDDVIDVVHTRETDGNSSQHLEASKHGLSAIYLTTLFQASPTITSISPAYGDIAGGEKVRIIGTGFNATTTVTFDEDAATEVTVNSTTRLTVLTPVHAAGYVDVTVNNGLGVTSENAYQYLDVTSNSTGSSSGASFPSANKMAGATVYVIDSTNYRIWSGTITSNTTTTWTVDQWTGLFNAAGYLPTGTVSYYIGYIYLYDKTPYYSFSSMERYGDRGHDDTNQKTLNRIEYQTNKIDLAKTVYTNLSINHADETEQGSFSVTGDYSYWPVFAGRHRNFQMELALLTAEEIRIKEVTYNLTWDGEGIDQ